VHQQNPYKPHHYELPSRYWVHQDDDDYDDDEMDDDIEE
jgi:hypothetical protein